MKCFLIVVCCLFAGLAYAADVEQAIAVISGTSNGPNVRGTVTFESDNNEVIVTVSLTGLPEGDEFAIHVHADGDISAADGTSTGGHFVGRDGNDHACPGTSARHVGDMGNWNAVAGVISQTKRLDLLALNGRDSIIGRGVTVHAGSDDCTTQPTGDAGARLAVGVVGVASVDAGDTNEAEAEKSLDVTKAVAILEGTSNCVGCSGVFYFSENSNGITITGHVSGLSDTSPRGVHIHQYGDISNPAGTSAGGHWNPDNEEHNLPPAEPRHQGDLGVITGYSSGDMYFQKVNTYLKSIDSILGRAVIVHDGLDHGDGNGCDQAGNAGARVLMGVIGRANVATAPTIPSGVQDLNLVVQSTDCVASVPSASSGAGYVAASTLVVLIGFLAAFC